MDLPEERFDPDSDGAAEDALLLCGLGHGAAVEIAATLAAEPGFGRVDGLDTLEARLAARPGTRALVLYDPADRVLSDAARDGTPLGAALSAWAEQAQALLALQTRNRRRIVLIEATAAQRYADVFAGRFGLSADCAARLGAAPRDAPDPVLRALAVARLRDEAATRRLAAALRAATTTLSNADPDHPSDDDAVEPARAHYAALAARLAALDAETARQREREHALSSEITTLRDTRAALDEATQRVAALETETGTQAAEIDRLRQDTAALARDRDGLQARLAETQSDLERQYRRRHALEAGLEEATQRAAAFEAETRAKDAEIARLGRDRDGLQARLGDAEHWLQGILASRSYRIMAPVRRLRAAFGRKE